MTRRMMIVIPLAAILFAITRLSSDAQVKTSASLPVQQVDHIMIRADEPGSLYAFFTETLQLPVAWPLATRGGVTSAGVGFGNVNVEAIEFPGQKPSRAQLVGFGFEPSPLAECLTELERRGIRVSLQRAKAFLLEKGLLGSVSGKEVTIDPAKIQGVNIRLVE